MIEELQAELKDLEENGEQTQDDLEGFVDVLKEMTEEEREEWNDGIQPIRGALIKVSTCLKQLRINQLTFAFFGNKLDCWWLWN